MMIPSTRSLGKLRMLMMSQMVPSFGQPVLVMFAINRLIHCES